MQKVHFGISDLLAEQIDAAILKWGFSGRTEFFRTIAIEFLRKDAEKMPPEEVLRDYTRAIISINRGRKDHYCS